MAALNMIIFACPQCGKRHAVWVTAAGRQWCCDCGAAMVVPEMRAAVQSESPKEIGQLDFQLTEKNARYLKIGGAVIGTVIVFTIVCALYFNNKWERDNREQLLALKAQADAMVRAKKYETAKLKYDEIFRLLDGRDLNDNQLKTEIASARLAAIDNNKKVEVILAARAAAEQAKRTREAAAESMRRSAEALAAATVRSQEIKQLTDAGVSEYLAGLIADQPPGASKLKFDEIRDGMSYYDVAYLIIGESGELQASSENLKIYSWRQPGRFGGNMSVTFREEKVISKAQAGLR